MNDGESMSVSPISFPSGKGVLVGGVHHTPSYDRKSHPDSSKHLPRVSSSKNTTQDSLDANNDRQIADESLDLISAKQLQKSLITVKRKDTARRQLMCSMYSKHNSVKRSFSFVAGERPADMKFPSVNYHEDETKWTRDRKNKTGNQNGRNVQVNTSTSHKYLSSGTKNNSNQRQNGASHSVTNNRISLPDIIMDFNFETNMTQNGQQTVMTSLSDSDDDDFERALGAPYEEYLKKTKLLAYNPCKARHRPITPGLLESLNKLRLPSKTKTEQWLKSVTNTRKSYCNDNYKVGNLVNSNLAIPNWIYTDT